MDYVVRRSTLADANKRRPQEFFAKVYAYLLGRYGSFLSDSRPKGEQKTWEKLLYMMDSTTFTRIRVKKVLMGWLRIQTRRLSLRRGR